MNTAASSNPRIISGIDPGLGTGAIVTLDRADRDHAHRERVVSAIDLSEGSGAVKDAWQQARDIADRFPGAYDIEFLAAHLRSRSYAGRVVAALRTVEGLVGERVNAIAIESFDDQAQHAKTMKKDRWKTPLSIGVIVSELAVLGYRVEDGTLVYQNSGLVLKQHEKDLARLEARKTKDLDMVRPGDRLISNGHKRSAFAHAVAFGVRLDQARCPMQHPNHAQAA